MKAIWMEEMTGSPKVQVMGRLKDKEMVIKMESLWDCM